MKTLNFTYSSAPLVETAAINFQMLGVGKNHPARSVSDTFYVNAEHHSLLRTHSTNHTIHKLKAIAEKNHICQGEHAGYTIGPVFRRDDDDATHSHQFYQMDAFLVGRNASMGELKSLLTIILNQIFTKTIKIRFRSSYFPFTSPSLEVDVECQNNHNDDAKKCSMCKNSGFIEILGGGMINPLVFKKCGFQN